MLLVRKRTGGDRWGFPAGYVGYGTSIVETAVSELAEETGLTVEPDALRGPLMRRFVVHGYSDQVLAQSELFYVLQVPAPFELDTSGFTDEEKLTIAAWDWHSIDQLAALTEPVWPVDLAELVALAGQPAAWPVDAGVVEESTVNAGELGTLNVRGSGEVPVNHGDTVWLTPDPSRIHRFDADGKAL